MLLCFRTHIPYSTWLEEPPHVIEAAVKLMHAQIKAEEAAAQKQS